MPFRLPLHLYLFSALFIVAGINHFIIPEIYLGIIPPYLPYPALLNYFAAVTEIGLGTLLLFEKTKKLSAVLIIMLLIAFIPAHIFMIQIAPFYLGKIYISVFVAWLRLPVQLLLILWAYKYYRKEALEDR